MKYLTYGSLKNILNEMGDDDLCKEVIIKIDGDCFHGVTAVIMPAPGVTPIKNINEVSPGHDIILV